VAERDCREPAARIPRLCSPRVVVVGDVMLDEYVAGASDRISPEAPVPVVRVLRRELVLGGAGNVAANIASLGGRPDVVAAVGALAGVADPAVGEKLLAIGASDRGLVPCADRLTTRKTRLLAGMHQIARFDEESISPLADAERDEILRRAEERLAEADLMVLSDYGKGVLTPAVITELMRAAQEHRLPTVVDPKGPDFRRYRGATLLTPNAREARVAVGAPPDDDDWNAITGRLVEEADVAAIAVTCGPAGIVLRRREDREVRHLPTRALDVFDVIGAGDTVVAALAVAIGSGLDLVTAAELANQAAGVVVQKRGTSTVSLRELAAGSHASGADKVMTMAEAVALVDEMRRRGGRVVFSNGCFDLLHAGHVDLLEKARRLGDVLIVGLNSDASVRRLKGEGRPIYSLATRARILASLAAVDAVVPFDEPTPAELIRQLAPELLVKGGDYDVEKIVGRQHAGDVVTIPIVERQSTTSTLQRIRNVGLPGEGRS
jgi:D-beta-D-heptose 7-phosphate kinase / D-beta-D-heptose 1-phosphate adenosyltransferase